MPAAAAAAVVSESPHGLGRLILLLALSAAFLCRGPQTFDGLSWGDIPDRNSDLKFIGKAPSGAVYSRPGGIIPLGKQKLYAQNSLFVFDADGLSAVMYQIPTAPSDPSGVITAQHWERQLKSQYGPAYERPSQESFIRGAKFRWRTRRCDITLGKSEDGFFHLLYTRFKK